MKIKLSLHINLLDKQKYPFFINNQINQIAIYKQQLLDQKHRLFKEIIKLTNFQQTSNNNTIDQSIIQTISLQNKQVQNKLIKRMFNEQDVNGIELQKLVAYIIGNNKQEKQLYYNTDSITMMMDYQTRRDEDNSYRQNLQINDDKDDSKVDNDSGEQKQVNQDNTSVNADKQQQFMLTKPQQKQMKQQTLNTNRTNKKQVTFATRDRKSSILQKIKYKKTPIPFNKISKSIINRFLTLPPINMKSLMLSLKNNTIDLLKQQFTYNNNKITLQKFIWLMKQCITYDNKRQYQIMYQLIKLFQQIDIDCNQFIDWEQFLQYIACYGWVSDGGNSYINNKYLYEQQMKYNSQPQTQRKIPQKIKIKKQQIQKTGRNRLQYQKTNKESINQPQQESRIPQQCEQYFTVIPQIIFKNIFSGDKNLRQHAIQQTIQLIQKIQQQEYLQRLFINGVIFIVKHTIDDKIVSILQKSIELLGSMFKQYKPKPQQIQRQNLRYVKDILEKLSQYLGHANEKLKSQAEDVYIVLPKFSKLTSKQLCIQTITLNQKMDRSPRVIISKLQMLGQLIRKYDQQKLKSNQSIMANEKKQRYQDVIEYSKRFLEDRNSEVRSTAMRLLVFVGKIIGTRDLLASLEDIKQSTLKIIQEKLSSNQQQSYHNNSLIKQRSLSPKNQSPKVQNSRIMSPKKSPTLMKKTDNNDKRQSPKITSNKNPLPQQQNKFAQNKQKPKSFQNKPKPTQQQQIVKYQPKNPQYICQYCQKYDKRLQNQNYRDVHWFKFCPMITICKQCKQAVQVQLLNQHLLQQCERKKYYKKCPRCKQAVLAKQYNQHVEKKGCIAAKPVDVANRCAHCHQDIEPKKKGWLKHLVEQGCPCQNDRIMQ